MTETKSLKKKLLAFFLMIAVTITMIPMGLISSTESADAATTYSFTAKATSISVKGSDGKTYRAGTTKFTISSLGATGVCAQAGIKHSGSGKTTITTLSNKDTRAKLAYYYGYQKGWANTASSNRIKLARAFSYLTHPSGTCWPFSKAAIRSFINSMPSVTVPDGFRVYLCNPTDKSQDFVVWRMLPSGKAKLVKTSTDSKSLAAGTGYNFTGVKYTVYNSSGKSVGTLTCNASGTTNTLTLAPGTYTAKETATNDWYEQNSKVYTFTVKSSTTTTIKASDAPKTGLVNIQKYVTDKTYDGPLAFSFKLTNTANSSIVYNVTTDESTGKASVDVVQGTYKIEEVLTDAQKDQNFVDETGPQTETIEIGETYTFERYNAKPRKGTLVISKTVSDGGPAAGFLFKVTGKLFNYGTINEKKILDTAAPKLATDHTGYDLGEWKVDSADVAELNKAAKNWENGIKKVTLTNKLTYDVSEAKTPEELLPKLTEEQPHPDAGEIEANTLVKDGNTVYKALEKSSFDIAYVMVEDPDVPGTQIEKDPAEIDQDRTLENIKSLLKSDKFEAVDTSDINLSFDVPVNLKDVEYVYDEASPDDAAFERDLDKQVKGLEKDTASADIDGNYPVEFNKFSWYGAATIYKEIEKGKLTGNDYSLLTTGEKGQTDVLEEGVSAGTFTVEEIMTDDQAKRYHQPQSQTKTIEDENAAFTFNFENNARAADVKLKKTCEDGNIAGIKFNLKGENSLGQKIDLTGTTDENGYVDFGILYKGEYIISEPDFDISKYKNTNKLDGYDVPAQKLVVTGDETEDITVNFVNVPQTDLYLTKVDKDTQSFLGNGTFGLYEGDKELAAFDLVLDEEGNAKIDFIRNDADLYADTPDSPPTATGDAGDGLVTGIEQDGVRYNYAVLKGLEEGKQYRIKELTAPSGYSPAIDYTFTFKDGENLIMQNTAPGVGTTALDKDTGLHMSNASGTVTIVDTVSYTDLEPGHMYRLTGSLVYKTDVDTPADGTTEDTEDVGEDADQTISGPEGDPTTFQVVQDANGKNIIVDKLFVPDTANGTVDVEFTFDASLLDGRQTVVFEELYDPSLPDDEQLIASHSDADDENQSIYFPAVETTATADDTLMHITNADGEVIITDVVQYSNVIAGEVYDITGTLMNKATGEPALDANGNRITATQKFKATADGPELLSEDGSPMQTTEDTATIDTPDQNDPQTPEVTPEEPSDADTGDGVMLVSGSIELKFIFDGSNLAGETLVAFEELTTAGKLVGEHKDINDEDQTVYVPDIGTKAARTENNIITDKVAYKNLIAGEKYIMKGVLVDKDTGEAIEETRAEKEFIPTQPNGIMKLDLKFNYNELKNHEVVAFEQCYIETEIDGQPVQVMVGSHEDLNDENQTVDLTELQTGQNLPWIIAIAGLILVLSGTYIAINRKKLFGND